MHYQVNELFTKLTYCGLFVSVACWAQCEIHASRHEAARNVRDHFTRVKELIRSCMIVPQNYSIFTESSETQPRPIGKGLIDNQKVCSNALVIKDVENINTFHKQKLMVLISTEKIFTEIKSHRYKDFQFSLNG